MKVSCKNKWFRSKDGKGIYTFWGGQHVSYGFDVKQGGDYLLQVDAKNFIFRPGFHLPPKSQDTHFKLAVTVDGERKGELHVEADDPKVKTGVMKLKGIKPGPHKIRLEWLNDFYKPIKKIDANIEIRDVKLQKVDSRSLLEKHSRASSRGFFHKLGHRVHHVIPHCVTRLIPRPIIS